MDWAATGPTTSPETRRASTRNPTSAPYLRLMTFSFHCQRERAPLLPETLALRTSVRVRPERPVAAESLPDASEPLRLVHEEQDDGEAEHDVARGGDEAEGARVDSGERSGAQLQDLGQQGHEDRPEDRSQDAAHAADDDHSQVVDGHQQREGVGEEDLRMVGHQPARDAGIEGADHESEELVLVEAHPHHGRRHILIANGDEGAANPGAEEIASEEDGREDEGEDQEEDAS